jgi:hypothetical protein
MNTNQLFTKVMPGILLALALATSAKAETLSYYQAGSVSSSGSTYFAFDITPFDSSLGTLNSVTLYAEVNVSGSAQLWSSDEYATLSVSFWNTLDAIAEMDWSPIVASYQAEDVPLWYYDYDYGEGYVQESGSGNEYAFGTIVTDFGRFLGADPFQIGLQLSGLASSTGSGDTLVFSYDGDARVSYDYDYTPIPEPGTLLLVGFGLVGLAGLRRTKK